VSVSASARVVVGIVSRTFYYVPLWWAIRERAFERAGLEVEICLLGHADPVTAQRKGQCAITIAPPDSILQDVDRGGDSVILAGNADRLSHRLVTQPEFDSVSALVGARIGVLSRTEGSFFHFQLLARAHGLRFPEEFVVVETGGAPLRHELLLRREIDAGLQSLPWVYLEEAAGLRSVCDICDVVPVWQFNTINAERDWIARHSAVVGPFLDVLRSAHDRFYRDGRAMTAVACEEMHVPEAYAERAWAELVAGHCLSRNLQVHAAGLACVHGCLAAAGLVDGSVPFSVDRYVFDSGRWASGSH
jgi:ABC-type nitrate/sulfonate/bicarbonate transport system substrate-binding protein